MIQVSKSLVDTYFNKLMILGSESYALTPYFESTKLELKLKMNKKTSSQFTSDYYFARGLYEYSDNIELTLAYTRCYYYMVKFGTYHKCHGTIHDFLRYVLKPHYWNVLMYIYENITPLESDKIHIASIYSQFGADFTKKVIEHNILIRYNYEYFTGWLIRLKDYDMFYYLMGKLVNTYWVDIINNSGNFQGVTSFMYACRNGDMDMIKYLLDNTKVDIAKYVNAGYNRGALFVFDMVETYSDCNYNNAALICACAGGHLNAVKFLLDMGANVNTLYEKKYNLATIALVGCNLDLVNYLVNEFELPVQLEFIKLLCKHGTSESVEFVYNNFEVNRSEAYTKLLFDLAYEYTNIPVMEYLVIKVNSNILHRVTSHYFVKYCLIESDYIRSRVFELNREFIYNAIEETEPGLNNDIKESIGIKLDCYYETKLFDFLTSQESKPVMLSNFETYKNKYPLTGSTVLLTYKTGEDYLVCANWSIGSTSRLHYYRLNKQVTIKTWASNFIQNI